MSGADRSLGFALVVPTTNPDLARVEAHLRNVLDMHLNEYELTLVGVVGPDEEPEEADEEEAEEFERVLIEAQQSPTNGGSAGGFPPGK